MIITLKGANFSNSRLPIYTGKLDGYTSDNLQNLYLFDGDNEINGSVDKLGNYNTQVVKGTASDSLAENLPNGGLRFTKNGYIKGGAIDLTQPYTLMSSMKLGTLSPSTLSAIMSVEDYFNYGFVWYGSAGSTANSDSLVNTVLRQAVNGKQDATTDKSIATNIKYSDYITFFLNYDGNGNMYVYLYDGDLLINSGSRSINVSGYTNNANSVEKKSVNPIIGGVNSFFSGTDINLDVFAVYTKQLSVSEMENNAKKSKEIMISRGRI